jgi:hypothetical protein
MVTTTLREIRKGIPIHKPAWHFMLHTLKAIFFYVYRSDGVEEVNGKVHAVMHHVWLVFFGGRDI